MPHTDKQENFEDITKEVMKHVNNNDLDGALEIIKQYPNIKVDVEISSSDPGGLFVLQPSYKLKITRK